MSFREEERGLKFNKWKGICNLKQELSLCKMQNLEFVSIGFD